MKYLLLDSFDVLAILPFAVFAVLWLIGAIASVRQANKKKFVRTVKEEKADPFSEFDKPFKSEVLAAREGRKIERVSSPEVKPSAESHVHPTVTDRIKVEERISGGSMIDPETEGCKEHNDERVLVYDDAYSLNRDEERDFSELRKMIVFGEILPEPLSKKKYGRRK